MAQINRKWNTQNYWLNTGSYNDPIQTFCVGVSSKQNKIQKHTHKTKQKQNTKKIKTKQTTFSQNGEGFSRPDWLKERKSMTLQKLLCTN